MAESLSIVVIYLMPAMDAVSEALRRAAAGHDLSGLIAAIADIPDSENRSTLLGSVLHLTIDPPRRITPNYVTDPFSCFMCLLNSGADPNTMNPRPPLHQASLSEYYEEYVQSLLIAGADVELRTPSNGETALHRSEPTCARLLLEHGADKDAADLKGYTPLHRAAYDGNQGLVKLLLESGANTEARTHRGYTPLHLACKTNRLDCATDLLDGGADMEPLTNKGLTPLRIASEKLDMDCMLLLIQRGVNVNAAGPNGETLIHIACSYHLERPNALALLQHVSADFNARDEKQMTPLHWLCMRGPLEYLNTLLSGGANIAARDIRGRTALHHAAMRDDGNAVGFITLLLDAGSNRAARDSQGRTPFMVARTSSARNRLA